MSVGIKRGAAILGALTWASRRTWPPRFVALVALLFFVHLGQQADVTVSLFVLVFVGFFLDLFNGLRDHRLRQVLDRVHADAGPAHVTIVAKDARIHLGRGGGADTGLTLATVASEVMVDMGWAFSPPLCWVAIFLQLVQLGAFFAVTDLEAASTSSYVVLMLFFVGLYVFADLLAEVGRTVALKWELENDYLNAWHATSSFTYASTDPPWSWTRGHYRFALVAGGHEATNPGEAAFEAIFTENS